MKTIVILVLLFVNATLLTFYTAVPDSVVNKSAFVSGIDSTGTDSTQSSQRRANIPHKNSAYVVDVSFQPAQSKVVVSENLKWFNNSPDTINDIFLHMYLNAFKSNNTVFGQSIPVPEASVTHLEIQTLLVNNQPASMDYINTEIANPSDSTVGRIKLLRKLGSRDSVSISISYSFRIPEVINGIGSNPSHSFYTLADYLIKPGIYERSGHWNCSPYFPYTGKYSEFADYTVSVTAPDAFSITASGEKYSSLKPLAGTTKYRFAAKNAVDFAWCAAINYHSEVIQLGEDGSGCQVNFFLPDAYKKYLPRYTASLQRTYNWLHTVIGNFPFPAMNIAIAPENDPELTTVTYPQLSIIRHNLLTPVGELLPERLCAEVLAEQYFKACISTDQVNEAWISDGIAGFLTGDILQNSFGDPNSFAYFFDVYPVKGLTLLKFADIPLVYTLSTLKIPPVAPYLKSYYAFSSITALAENSSEYHSAQLFESGVAGRGTVFFHAVQNLLGSNRMQHFLSSFYEKYKGKQAHGMELLQHLKPFCSANEYKYIDQFYREGGHSDYAILDATQLNAVTYAVRIANFGNINFPVMLSIQSSSDTLSIRIDPDKKLQTLYVTSANPVLAFELDRGHDNLFDINFANNSFTMSKSYSSSLYFSVRWFYWMQSLILVFGGLS